MHDAGDGAQLLADVELRTNAFGSNFEEADAERVGKEALQALLHRGCGGTHTGDPRDRREVVPKARSGFGELSLRWRNRCFDKLSTNGRPGIL